MTSASVSSSVVLAAACAVAAVASSPAGAVARERLIGFQASGEVAYVAVDDEALGKLTRICRLNTTELPGAWPPALAIGDGEACAVLTDEAAGAPAADFAKNGVAGSKAVKASPWGLKVNLAVTDTSHAVTITSGPPEDGGTIIRATPVTSAVPLKLGDVLWRADGRAAAITLDGGKKGPSTVIIMDASTALVGGPAGRKLAAARLKDATALMKKRNWSDAGRVLDEAILADPDNAAVRYARAAAEAQSGIGMSTMIDNLTWLKERVTTNKDAKKLLDGAQKDSAFDAWVGEPDVRALIDLPPLKDMRPEARLLERSATFTRQGASCKTPWVTLMFQKGGKGIIEIASRCKGKGSPKVKQPFAWKVDGDVVTMTTKAKTLGDDETLPAAATLELDGTYQQVRLTTDGVSAIGPFEPGIAHIDDAL